MYFSFEIKLNFLCGLPTITLFLHANDAYFKHQMLSLKLYVCGYFHKNIFSYQHLLGLQR